MNKDKIVTEDELPILDTTKITSYSLFVAIIYTLIQIQVYYQLFLHIPIFQYLDISEVLLLAPATGIPLAIYLFGVNFPNYIIQQEMLGRWQKAIISIIAFAIACIYFYVAYKNDQTISGFISIPIRYWWLLLLIGGIVGFFSNVNINYKRFIKRHKAFIPLLYVAWYALFTGYSSYYGIQYGEKNLLLKAKLKDGSTISTNHIVIFAGRTHSYWFFYNRKTNYTRVVKDEEIQTADFKSTF